ncbi:hypothetical protein IAT38_006697 [Cryptococcus sp. DSM 104549]
MDRSPLTSLPHNTFSTPTASSSSAAGPSNALASASASAPGKPKPKLAPIFTRKRRATVSEHDENTSVPIAPGNAMASTGVVGRVKRVHHAPQATAVRVSASSSSTASSSPSPMDVDERDAGVDVDNLLLPARGHSRVGSIHDYFSPSTSLSYGRVEKMKGSEREATRVVVPKPESGVWRRGRRRVGVGRSLLERDTFIPTQPPYLSTLVHSVLPYHPLVPPSVILLPSVHPPMGRPREFAPPMALSFNHIAKQWDASEARTRGMRRLIAVAGEEGGVRIVDVDEGLGVHREEKGWWWRAHGNAIFDIKWSGDDKRVLTSSGDLSTRLHALTTPTPTLLATLRGHTSSIKTSAFIDPSRGAGIDPSVSSSVIATAGRDGNILIYDVRCQGRDTRSSESPGLDMEEGGSRSVSRERYRDGVPGFVAQASERSLDPVMVIKGAHGDGKRSGRSATRSVTSLVALQSMPGVLASGGSFDGIVKLWDLRFPEPTARSPNPRPSCTPVGCLLDPTVQGSSPSRRARSINALCESPVNGDLYALCGDSKIHTLRPSAALHQTAADSPVAELDSPSREAIQPKTFSDPNLLVQSFYLRLSISPDGRYLASGSCRGGLMTWDTQARGEETQKATRLGLGMGGVGWPEHKDREICAVDWGKDMVAASADDLATRIWRENRVAARYLKEDPMAASEEWIGAM